MVITVQHGCAGFIIADAKGGRWVCCRLHRVNCTLFVLFLQAHPILKDDLELLENKVVGESVPAGVPLHEVVFVGGVFLQGAIQMHTIPTLPQSYQ